MGRGSSVADGTMRLRASSWQRVPQIDAGLLRVEVERVKIEEQGAFYPCAHTQLWISDQYPNQESIANEIKSMLEQTPAKLRQAASQIAVLGSYAPAANGVETGAACAEEGVVMVFRVRENHDQPGLSLNILEHELAHVAAEGGPPKELALAWQLARKRDQAHSSGISSELSKGVSAAGELKIGGRVFLLAEEWLSSYSQQAEENSREDWASAVESYLAFQRLPAGGLQVAERVFTFEDLYPNRARLVADFLS